MTDVTARRVERYEPRKDAAQRWPDWSFERAPLRGIPEIVCPKRRVVLLDDGLYDADEDWVIAHTVAHLDLRHHETAIGRFSEEDEAQANYLASIRLDREGSRRSPHPPA